MVEDSRDKSSTNGRILSGFEKLEFELLKTHLHVDDYFDRSNPIKFSWDSRRHDGHRVLVRLDRCYTFANFNNRRDSHILEYEILGDCTLSDHLPIFLSLQILVDNNRKGSHYKTNKAYLQDPKVVELLRKEWESAPTHMGFFGKLRRVIRWYKVYCINAAA